MKSKTLGLTFLSILALVFLISAVSATEGDVAFNPIELIISGDAGETVETTFTITNERATDLTDISAVPSDLILDTFTIDDSNLEVLGLDELTLEEDEESGDITLSITIPTNQELGDYTGTVEIWGVLTADSLIRGTINITLTVTDSEFDFCQYDNDDNEGNPNNNLRIDIDNVDNQGEFGDDDEWYPGSEIEVKVIVDNKGEEKIEDIEVEWGLYDSDADAWVIEVENEDDFNLKENKDKSLTFSFTIEDGDFDINLEDIENEDLLLYVRATGYDNEDEKTICVMKSEEIKLILDDDFVILENIQVLPETAQCGSRIQVTADVWNIGDSEQDDVFILVYNNKEGINEIVEIDGGVDAFDKEDLNLFITLPSDLEEKAYPLYFIIYDDEEMSSNDIFENSDNEEAKFEVTFEVSGNCISNEPQALITINSEDAIQSGGEAGEELVVKVKITNIGTQLTTYDLSALGYSDWAESAEFDSDTLVLGAGSYEYILVTLNVNEDVLGEQEFNVEVSADGDLILTQLVEVTITDSGIKFPRITGSVISGDNWYLWGIGALNVILIIIIIIVAIKVAKN